MTVKELIEGLQQFPQDMTVLVRQYNEADGTTYLNEPYAWLAEVKPDYDKTVANIKVGDKYVAIE